MCRPEQFHLEPDSAYRSANLNGWDIRDPVIMATDLKRFGVERIVLRSLVGAQGAAPPIEALRCLAALDLPIDVDPIAPQLVAPWLCEGAESGVGVFGVSVDMDAWKTAYKELVPDLMEAAE